MYIEADAWATNLKQKLDCGSVLMSAKMEFYEFFTRALEPDVHYVEVDTHDMCHDTARKVNAEDHNPRDSCCCRLTMQTVEMFCFCLIFTVASLHLEYSSLMRTSRY